MYSLIIGLIIFHFVLFEESYYEYFEDSLSYALYDRFKQICRGEF